jgi:hypothetical protein
VPDAELGAEAGEDGPRENGSFDGAAMRSVEPVGGGNIASAAGRIADGGGRYAGGGAGVRPATVSPPGVRAATAGLAVDVGPAVDAGPASATVPETFTSTTSFVPRSPMSRIVNTPQNATTSMPKNIRPSFFSPLIWFALP